MCGIFGYTGKKPAQGVVLDGLKHLEYRGYDSSGIAILGNSSKIDLQKTDGKLKKLEEILKFKPLQGHTAIGHTRWATHGVPNCVNAHPHLNETSEIAVVHNGIIENYSDLKKKMIQKGVRFQSETDTEVIVHAISQYYKGNLEEAVMKALKLFKGTYAMAVISSAEPGKIVCAKVDSPLVVGLGKNENFIASDVSALLEHTSDVIYIENGQMAVVSEGEFRLMDFFGKKLPKKPVKIQWSVAQAKKGGHEHFMIKEIFEQPNILTAILKERISAGKINFEELKISPAKFKKIKNIVIIGCGTAYHAGLTGKYILESLTPFNVSVDTSSEFRYRDPKIGKDTLVIAISQSGETADTLAGIREAKQKGATTLCICNVLSSSLARESHGVIYTHAGPEIAVASTKAYTAQLTILYLLGFYLAQTLKSIDTKQLSTLIKKFIHVPSLMQKFLDAYKKDEANWKKNAREFNLRYHQQLDRYYKTKDESKKRSPNGFFLYLGRNINYPNALEGALKLKEISYIPAEGYSAGEMKHGPIALIDENPWVICIACESKTYDKMISNIQEIKARSGIIIPIVTEGDKEIYKVNPSYVIEVPKVDELFSPLLTVLPLQLIAYRVAYEFGEDIDQPRNLAKSVTVE